MAVKAQIKLPTRHTCLVARCKDGSDILLDAERRSVTIHEKIIRVIRVTQYEHRPQFTFVDDEREPISEQKASALFQLAVETLASLDLRECALALLACQSASRCSNPSCPIRAAAIPPTSHSTRRWWASLQLSIRFSFL